ncbi:MAG: NTP transferase domain-containing protein [Candidatus Omnitrophota bacterium]|nr:NTP transferase domain-containing protein [Candidatus Omnitrophota bacterium]MDZ4242884.1 NTP transferase domain-containing protein [Candidatus Omnitrophota bacterium]
MKYKACILAAGAGARMGTLSQHVNKALLPVNFKATISHIIEKFPADVEVVVAVGHKKETLMDYLALAHPDRTFKFIRIPEYVGPGTGPGYSLLQCRQELNCPFVLFTADTIVLEEVPVPDKNWYGVAPVENTEDYCTIKIKNNLVCQIDDKVKTDNRFAWIGLAGIHDHQVFFSALEKNKDVIAGEIQVSNGFKYLIEKQLVPIHFTWFDTGTLKKYIETNKNLSGQNQGFDFSKSDEFLYFVEDRVIKYYANPEIIRKRYERSLALGGLTPRIEDRRENFYVYKKIDGQTLYSILNNQLLNDFLSWAEAYLWKKQELFADKKNEFSAACRKFYYDKTMERLKTFYAKTGLYDCASNVNGEDIPPLKELFEQVNWDYICDGIPATIHGDLQCDNVLVIKDKRGRKEQFALLDWRQDFGGLIEMGDLYYDLAKMYGGLTLSYQLIKEGMFNFDMSGSSVFYKYYVKSDLLEAREEYENFIVHNGFDLHKVKVMASLIFLNMSPLHNDPFDHLLHFLGKKMLYHLLTEDQGRSQASLAPLG